jgi:hypothetical protein
MDGWTIAFSPGGFHCQASWFNKHDRTWMCDIAVPPGYLIARHPNYGNEWMCLTCMVATAREYLRHNRIEILAGSDAAH